MRFSDYTNSDQKDLVSGKNFLGQESLLFRLVRREGQKLQEPVKINPYLLRSYLRNQVGIR